MPKFGLKCHDSVVLGPWVRSGSRVSRMVGARDVWGYMDEVANGQPFCRRCTCPGNLSGARCTHVVCCLHPHFCEGNFVPTNWSPVITPCLHACAESASSKNEDKRGPFEIAEETDLNKEVQIEGSAVIRRSTIDIAHPSPESRCPQRLDKWPSTIR